MVEDRGLEWVEYTRVNGEITRAKERIVTELTLSVFVNGRHFTTATITPPVGSMESRELQLTISSGCPMGNYPISIRAYNQATPTEEMWAHFTLEVTPSSGFMDMGMAMITLSPTFGSPGDQITVSGYGFPKSANLTFIRLGPMDVTPAVATSTDNTGAFSAVITVPNNPDPPNRVLIMVMDC